MIRLKNPKMKLSRRLRLRTRGANRIRHCQKARNRSRIRKKVRVEPNRHRVFDRSSHICWASVGWKDPTLRRKIATIICRPTSISCLRVPMFACRSACSERARRTICAVCDLLSEKWNRWRTARRKAEYRFGFARKSGDRVSFLGDQHRCSR